MTEQNRAILVWVVIGLVAGWLASLVVGTRGGLFGYLVAGLLGSFLGGVLARQFNIRLNIGNPLAEQVIVAFVGAIIVLIVARIVV